MSDDKQYKKEWSFSFDELGNKIREMMEPVNDADIHHEHFSEDVNGAERAKVQLTFGVAEARVSTPSTLDTLFEADIDYVGEIEYEATGEAAREIRLEQRERINGKSIRGVRGHKLNWDVRLSPNVPIELNVKGGLGSANLDLSGVNLTEATLKTGIGATEITLPALERAYEVDVKSGVGEVTINVIAGASAEIDINGGIGSVTVYVDPSAAVQVNGKIGMGSIDTPKVFKQVQGGRKFVSEQGIWETEGFAETDRQIVINFKGGVGNLEVRTERGEKKKKNDSAKKVEIV